jgi:predicted dehydrogenase
MKAKIRLALIGCGAPHAHSSHLPYLTKMEDISLEAVCDLDKEKLAEAQNKFNIKKGYTNFHEMLDKEELDAIQVIVRPSFLKDIVIPCFEKGLAVSVEKPAGNNSTEAAQMLEAAKKNNCLNILGLNRRFAPCITETKKQLKDASVRNVVGHFYRPYSGDCLPVSHHIIHGLDMMRFLGGEIESFKTLFRKRSDGTTEGFSALLQFKNGGTGTFNANSFCHEKLETYEVHTDEASAVIDYFADEVKIFKDNSLVLSKNSFEGDSSYWENRHFIDCVKAGIMPSPNLEDAFKIMRICEEMNNQNQ